MPRTHTSALPLVLLTFMTLPTLIMSYDCTPHLNHLDNSSGCSLYNSSDQTSPTLFSQCMLEHWSISAFIQCASQPDASDLTYTISDGRDQPVTPIEILRKAFVSSDSDDGTIVPECQQCALAKGLQSVINDPTEENLGKELCEQYHPTDEALQCLNDCLYVTPKEHSIEALCDGSVSDLMEAPEVARSIGSGSDGGSSAGGSSGGNLSTAATSSSANATLAATSSMSPGTTQTESSVASTTSSGATPTNEASASSTAQAASSAGNTSNMGVRYPYLLSGLGLAVLPILAIL